VAKFVPGLDGIAPPLAGIARTGRLRFLAFDTVGAGLYSCVYGGLGYVFSHDLDRAVTYAGRAGALLAGLAFAGLFIHVARKLVLRHHSKRESVVVRIAENSHGDRSAPLTTVVPVIARQGEPQC
jgi:membrane protein DedA with SNARE-associated domain